MIVVYGVSSLLNSLLKVGDLKWVTNLVSQEFNEDFIHNFLTMKGWTQNIDKLFEFIFYWVPSGVDNVVFVLLILCHNLYSHLDVVDSISFHIENHFWISISVNDVLHIFYYMIREYTVAFQEYSWNMYNLLIFF